MGFRFSKSLRILPGVRLNLSKTGPSISLGRNGATLNLSRKGSRATVGVPGTGVSYTKTRSHGEHTPLKRPSRLKTMITVLWTLLIAAMIAWAFYQQFPEFFQNLLASQ